MKNKKHTNRELMEMAVEISKKSNSWPEDPKVGAVIAKNGIVLATGYRGEFPNTHAEAAALKKIKGKATTSADLFTTLEPCSWRSQTATCSDLLVQRKIGRVFIGMLDPNRRNRGQGEWSLENQGIQIGKFDPDLNKKIRKLNKYFINFELGLGLKITKPKSKTTANQDEIEVIGSYQVYTRPGRNMLVFCFDGINYWPQGPIIFDRKKRTWKCLVNLPERKKSKSYQIIVAQISDDLAVLCRHYAKVHRTLNKKVGIEMDPLPSGLEVLSSVTIIRKEK